MGHIDTKATLWANVQALMVKHYGEENLTRLAKETGVGLGTAGRIKEMKTSAGIDTMERIADRFNLAVWQLLVPGMDAANPPALQPVSPAERALYENIMSAAKAIVASEPDAGRYLK